MARVQARVVIANNTSTGSGVRASPQPWWSTSNSIVAALASSLAYDRTSLDIRDGGLRCLQRVCPSWHLNPAKSITATHVSA
eukprot:6077927-Amphidinium_carterae.1